MRMMRKRMGAAGYISLSGGGKTFIFWVSNVRFLYFLFLVFCPLLFLCFKSTIIGQSCRARRDIVEFQDCGFRSGPKYIFFRTFGDILGSNSIPSDYAVKSLDCTTGPRNFSRQILRDISQLHHTSGRPATQKLREPLCDGQ